VARFDAVLFDNGDTLFHKPLAPPAIVSLAGELGATVDADAAREAWESVKRAKHSVDDTDLVFGRNRSADGHRRYYLRCYEPLDRLCPGLAEAFYREFKTSASSMIPYPDTRATLEAIHRSGLAVGIVSNTGWNIRVGYERAGLADLVDCFVLSYEHGMAKPEPELFALAARALHIEPSRTLMVGNNGRADSGAVELGCTCLILPPVSRGAVRGLDAVLRLAELEEVSDMAGSVGVPGR
jgi:HAD superfamily hydrolase (TIGR01493 family)